MIVLRLLAVVLAACSTAPTTVTPPSATVMTAGIGQPDPDADRACAETTLRSLVAAFNDGDDDRLAQLAGVAGSPTLSGLAFSRPEDAVAALLARRLAGERWTLARLDFNGRGHDGAVHFGLVLRRAGPDLPSPYVESAGKGALDCPRGRLLVLGIGNAELPRASDSPR